MKLTRKFTILMFVIFAMMISMAFTKKAHKAHKARKANSKTLPNLPGPMATYITDKSSIWNAGSTVDLLIILSREITTPEVITGKVSLKQFQDAQSDCLGNLKNLGGKWGNNMRYFWNVVTDYYKTKNDKAIVEKTFEEAFAMANDQAATGHFAGKKCTSIFVMDFKADKTKKIIEDFLKKFNLVPPKTPLITSFIGTHRNIAPPGFFKKMNRDRRRRR